MSVLQILARVAIALTIVGSIHFYLWWRLVRSTTTSRRARSWGAAFITLLALTPFAALFGEFLVPRSVATVLAWPGYLWLAVMFYLLLTLIVLELPAVLARAASRALAARRARGGVTESPVTESAVVADAVDHGSPRFTPESAGVLKPQPDLDADSGTVPDSGAATGPGTVPDPGRRLFIARSVAIMAGLAATGTVAVGMRSALGPLRVSRIDVPIARLPRVADGFRVALVADVHLGPLSGVERTQHIVDLINGLDADLVAIVGDLVDGSVPELGPAAAPLRDLTSRHGSFFVTGNHEYYSGYQQWLTEVDRLGIRVLRNERVELPVGVDLAGVNDLTGTDFADPPDLDRTLAGRDPRRPVVLLAHQPAFAEQAARAGVDLQLSGHTHGGQLAPFNRLVSLAGQPVVSGLGTVAGMPVYVTNGAGFWGPPVRVGAPPDVTLVRLRQR